MNAASEQQHNIDEHDDISSSSESYGNVVNEEATAKQFIHQTARQTQHEHNHNLADQKYQRKPLPRICHYHGPSGSNIDISRISTPTIFRMPSTGSFGSNADTRGVMMSPQPRRSPHPSTRDPGSNINTAIPRLNRHKNSMKIDTEVKENHHEKITITNTAVFAILLCISVIVLLCVASNIYLYFKVSALESKLNDIDLNASSNMNYICKCDDHYSTNTSVNYNDNYTTNSINNITSVTTNNTLFATQIPATVPTMQIQHADVSIGDYKVSAANQSAIDERWLLCDGSLIDNRDYPLLFDIIGYSFDISLSINSSYNYLFSLPNATNRVIGFAGNYHQIGDIIGAENINHLSEIERIQLTEDNLPSHSHYIMTNGGACSSDWDAGDVYLVDVCNSDDYYQLRSSSEYPNQGQTSSVGSGQTVDINIMQPTVFVGNLFIYAG